MKFTTGSATDHRLPAQTITCPNCGHCIAAPLSKASTGPTLTRESANMYLLVGLVVALAGVLAASTKPNQATLTEAFVRANGGRNNPALSDAKLAYHDYVVLSTLTAENSGGSQQTLAVGFFGLVSL